MDNYATAAKHLREADAVLIGASNGLSITEGLNLFADNDEFGRLFGDMRRKYGLRCILQGMMAEQLPEAVRWAFWARLIRRYCGDYTATHVMRTLRKLVGDKDYFVLTSNGEGHFEAAGFDDDKVYEIEGSWLKMQCARPCHRALYPTLPLAEAIVSAETEGDIPQKLLPRCPKCGGEMRINMVGSGFIPDTAAQRAMKQFLQKYHGRRLCILELGIGPRNRLIKAPLMQLAARGQNTSYITVNRGEIFVTPEISHKAVTIDAGIEQALDRIAAEYQY